MTESGYYPPGAEFDPNAPYNQSEPEPIKLDVYITQVFSKPANIEVTDYEYEIDEFGKYYDTSNCDLKGATCNQVTTIEDILTELPKIYKELTANDSGTITKYQLNRLKVLAKACEDWNLDEFEVVEDEV